MEVRTLHRIVIGRFNPPHAGHERLLRAACATHNTGGFNRVYTRIFFSCKSDLANNPLSAVSRREWLSNMASRISEESKAEHTLQIKSFDDQGLFGALKKIQIFSKDDVVQIFGGTDRIEEYANRFFKLRAKREMDPLLANVDVMFSHVPRESPLFSSTFARDMARAGHYEYFSAVMPKTLNEDQIKYLYQETRKGIFNNDNKGSDQKT